MRKAILSFVVAVSLMAPFCCYGYENSYVDTPEIWLENESVLTVNLEDSRFDGYFQYFTDSDSHTLYGHISHNCFIDDDVPVLIGIENDFCNIEFDDNGINDSDFCTGLSYHDSKNEVYFAVDFKNKDIRNNTDKLRVTIRIDGVAYLVCEQILIDIKDPIKTTRSSKQTTTKSKQTTAKFEKETTEKSAKNSFKKETTTKFKYTPEKAQTEVAEPVAEINTENTTESAIITSSSNTDEAHLSPTAITLLIIATAAIAIGTALILYANLKSKQSDANEETAADDTPEDEIIEEDPTADHMRKINLAKDLDDYDLDDLDE